MDKQESMDREIFLTRRAVDEIDLNSLMEFIRNKDQRWVRYFLEDCGKEHYKLLACLSQQLDDINIIDIGTRDGYSALSLSINPKNFVHTFDIVDTDYNLNSKPNIAFSVDKDVIESSAELILSSTIIFSDTDSRESNSMGYHFSSYEQKLVEFLHNNDYQGYVLIDDIHLNPHMQTFWDSLKYSEVRKIDLTPVGHWSGTGLLIYNEGNNG